VDTLTLDTNLLVEYWRTQAKRHVVEELIELARLGRIALAVTARIREDVPHDPLAAEVNRLPELGVAEEPSVARLGYWILGRDVLGSDAFIEAQEEIDEILAARGRTPPDWRDWDHLHAHHLRGRDAFLTWDRRLLEAADLLAERLAIRALTPEEYLVKRLGSGADEESRG
jgi:hypothetical protein